MLHFLDSVWTPAIVTSVGELVTVVFVVDGSTTNVGVRGADDDDVIVAAFKMMTMNSEMAPSVDHPERCRKVVTPDEDGASLDGRESPSKCEFFVDLDVSRAITVEEMSGSSHPDTDEHLVDNVVPENVCNNSDKRKKVTISF